MDCALCQQDAADEVWTGERWRVVVDRNQSTLGRCFIALKRHDEDISTLTDGEVVDLWATIRNTRDVLTARFRPDRFNYAFPMNQDRHAHLHVIPRYDGPRAFAGYEFAERDDGSRLQLPDHIHLEIVTAIREGFTGNFI